VSIFGWLCASVTSFYIKRLINFHFPCLLNNKELKSLQIEKYKQVEVELVQQNRETIQQQKKEQYLKENMDSDTICWSDELEKRLRQLYIDEEDVVDIFWGRHITEHLSESKKWHVYVIIHCGIEQEEKIKDEIIYFIPKSKDLLVVKFIHKTLVFHFQLEKRFLRI
jgi:hypothetical protein